jgi:NAD(P)-dependent dehydrogenase (short-subunit alcohol dehydrogenase family)
MPTVLRYVIEAVFWLIEGVLVRAVAITGGGTGLGLAMAKRFAADGRPLALVSRSLEHLEAGRAEILSEHKVEVACYSCDVRDVHAVRRTVTAIEERFDGIDIWVNNAAGNFVRPAENLPEKAFSTVTDIVLNGTFNASRAVGRKMIERRQGTILNIVATYAWTGGPGTVHSACAKAGVLAMTRTLAVEWARHGLRVVAIAPGAFDSSGAGDRLWPSEELRERVRAAIPNGRFATREEVANAAAWLVSDAASYINGECLTIDGGAWLGRGILGADEPLPTVKRKRRR